MTVSRTCYATREDIKRAAGWNGDAFDVVADRLAESHSDKIDELWNRRFFPRVVTRYYDWPSTRHVSTTRLFFDADILSVTSFTADGTTISASDYYLYPVDDTGKPYGWLELDADSDAEFGDGGQRTLVLVGVEGYSNNTTPAGALNGSINASVTSLVVTDSSLVGVGDLILIGTERMIVAGKDFADTTKNIAGNLDALSTGDTVTLPSSHGILAGEVIQVDSERMLVRSVAATSAVVDRAYDGTQLASHTNGADIYAPRTLTVVRGAYGTTAASHTDADAITRNVPPSLVRDLVIAEAIAQHTQESGGYGAAVGPSGQTTPDRIALLDLRKRAWEAYGRQERIWL